MERSLPFQHPLARVRNFIIGSPIRTSFKARESVGFLLGLPLFAVDALSSVAYATEEILLALLVAGHSFSVFSVPIACAITVLMFVIILSYSQTVQAYPNGGGAYVVAKNHLGTEVALVAGSALLVDYILTVAVSVTAGVRALISAFPSLQNEQMLLSNLSIIILMWVNLRGIRESAKAIVIPVYLFILTILALSGFGLMKAFQSVPGGSSFAHNSQDWVWSLAACGIILRAFAGGCTAMTGIEVVANAGSLLRKPHSVIARKILWALGIILSIAFLSITFVVSHLSLQPLEHESLISQVARLLVGDGIIHKSFQILTAFILFLAANSAFAGFPKLGAMLAEDEWLPKQFSALGDRLVYSQGIIWLSLAAILLVTLFQGETHALIPLYAIGVFLAFTISQLGMVRYWLTFKGNPQEPSKLKNLFQRHRRLKAALSGFGAILTAMAVFVTFEAKFLEGSFLVIIVIPIFYMICLKIKSHYKHVENQLRVTKEDVCNIEKNFSTAENRTVIVPVSRLHKGTLEALAFARQMTRDVRVLVVDIGQLSIEQIEKDLKNLQWGLEIMIQPSPYRSILQPVIRYVHEVDAERKKLAIMVLPELIPAHWWQNILHNRTANSIIHSLSWNENSPNQARIIINVPYYL